MAFKRPTAKDRDEWMKEKRRLKAEIVKFQETMTERSIARREILKDLTLTRIELSDNQSCLNIQKNEMLRLRGIIDKQEIELKASRLYVKALLSADS